jgi:hypothetical protein
VTTLACALWTAYTIGTLTTVVDVGGGDIAEEVLVSTPAVLGLFLLVWRPRSPTWLQLAFGWTLLMAVAYESQRITADNFWMGLAPLGLAAAAIAATRLPALAVVLAFALTGTHFSLEVFTGVSIGTTADLVLAALWAAVLWPWLSGRRSPPGWLPPSMMLLALYVLASLVYVFVAPEINQSAYAFRSSCWYMAAAFVVAFWLETPEQDRTVQRGILLAGTLVGAYAMLRWAIGPSNEEEARVRGGGPFVSDDEDEVRLFGSLPGPTALGVWTSVFVPFAIASALAPIGPRWRVVAIAGGGMCGAALAGADTRVGMLATAIGGVVVLSLFAVGRGFEGRRALPLALGLILALSGAGVFTASKLSNEGSSGERFRNILQPERDKSVQERLVKWETILDDADEQPFGKGLGQSGAAEQRYARFTSAASFDPDSTYVKIAYDQGPFVLLLFAGAVITLLAALAVRAVTAPTPQAAGLAVGACGGLAAFSVAMGAGVYFEGLGALAPWLIVGLAYASWIREATGREQ